MANVGSIRQRFIRKLELSHKLSNDDRVNKVESRLNAKYLEIISKSHYVNIYRIFLVVKPKHNKL